MFRRRFCCGEEDEVEGEDNTARMALVMAASSLSIEGNWGLRNWLSICMACSWGLAAVGGGGAGGGDKSKRVS